MKKSLLLALTVFVFFSACKMSEIDDVEWKKFTSEKGKFEAEFISKTTESVQKYPTEKGTTNAYIVKADTRIPRMTFQIMFADLPEEPIEDEGALKIKYDTLRDGLVKLRDSEVLSERDVYLETYMGREMIMKEGFQQAKSRVFIVGNRLYLILVGAETSFAESKEIDGVADKFLDSFKLIEGKVR